MELSKLKNLITTNTLNNDPIIMKYSDNKFLCNQYVNTIINNKGLEKVNIESIEEALNNDDLFESDNSTLYVLDTEKFTEYPTNEYKNLIVICKTLPDNLEIDYVDFTKPLNWQVEDYVKYRLQGLDEKEVIWLCQICKYDIYRLDQECRKLEIFPVAAQKQIFKKLNDDNGYCDLTDLNIFDFTEAVVKKDFQKISNMIPEMEIIDIEPLAVVTILIKKFKQLLAIATNNVKYATQIGMSEKQFWYLKKNQSSTFTDKKLINNIEFLTGIDYKIKSGNLDLSRSNLLSYIILNIL